MKKLRMKLVVDSEEFQAIKGGRKWQVRIPRGVFMEALPKDNRDAPDICEVIMRERFSTNEITRKVTFVEMGTVGVIDDYFGPVVRINFTIKGEAEND